MDEPSRPRPAQAAERPGAEAAADRDLALAGRSAASLAELVRRGAVSPREVVAAHLERIEALDGGLGAFQLVRGERALAEADELGRRADLPSLPLAGVPLAVKDAIGVAGEPTRNGSAATSAAALNVDDEAVRRLRAAGCVVIGKTRTPELCIWPFTESAAFGVTRNPWDPSRTPGGSSGGSAAAVAAGMVPLALGTDGLGSIRIPAAWCGVLGLKPGAGVVPLGRGGGEHWHGMSAWGPLASTPLDLACAFGALADDPGLDMVPQVGKPLRVAVSTRSPLVGTRLDGQLERALRQAAELLAGAGHDCAEADPPYRRTIALPVLQRWYAGAAEDAGPLDRERLEERTRGVVRVGRRLPAVKPATAAAWAARMAGFFAGYDVLLTPTVARLAPEVGRWAGAGWLRTTLGASAFAPYTAAWNLAGLPAVSVPAGLDASGLPLSVQLVAPAGGERLLLALAALLDELRPWPRHAITSR